MRGAEARIVSDPDIMLGKPTIRGKRITVEFVLCMMAAGRSAEELLREYPFLAKEDILRRTSSPPINSCGVLVPGCGSGFALTEAG